MTVIDFFATFLPNKRVATLKRECRTSTHSQQLCLNLLLYVINIHLNFFLCPLSSFSSCVMCSYFKSNSNFRFFFLISVFSFLCIIYAFFCHDLVSISHAFFLFFISFLFFKLKNSYIICFVLLQSTCIIKCKYHGFLIVITIFGIPAIFFLKRSSFGK